VLGKVVLLAAALAAATSSSAPTPRPRLILGVSGARANETVLLRAEHAGTKPLRLYLVPAAAARRVRSALDARVSFVGALVPDGRGRGSLRFTVPPLDSGRYGFVAWIPARGRGLIRPAGRTLGVETPTEPCPVTPPNAVGPRRLAKSPSVHGTNLLATFGAGRGYTTEADGTRFDKVTWVAASADVDLGVTYRRLDAPGALLRAETIAGHLEGFSGPSWAARMHFTEGCWLVRGRLRDVSLSYVVSVARP